MQAMYYRLNFDLLYNYRDGYDFRACLLFYFLHSATVCQQTQGLRFYNNTQYNLWLDWGLWLKEAVRACLWKMIAANVN